MNTSTYLLGERGGSFWNRSDVLAIFLIILNGT